MQNAGQAQIGKICNIETNGPAGKPELCRNTHQGRQRRTLDGSRVPAAKDANIHSVAVKTTDHGETGKAAFGHFRLQDDRQVMPEAE